MENLTDILPDRVAVINMIRGLSNERSFNKLNFIKKQKFRGLTFEQIKIEETVYRILALGVGSYMETAVIATLPYIGKETNSYFIGVRILVKEFMTGEKHSSDTEWSLEDCNVILNTYNHHRLFYNIDLAKEYLGYCRLNEVNLRIFKKRKGFL